MADVKYFPLGECALTVEFGTVISPELNRRAIALADRLNRTGFPGFIEASPAYATTTIFYDVAVVRAEYPDYSTAFDAVKVIVQKAAENIADASEDNPPRTVEIPVSFAVDDAPDLEELARSVRLTADEVIEFFLSRAYRVFMIGFLPGFPYMGELDERIAHPRRESPRLKVPKGSVGIAGRQTGVYPLESPGGWQIIGRTDVELFTPDAEQPSLLQPGDSVRFVKAGR